MSWLKCVPCFSYGYGEPEYRWIGSVSTLAEIEDAKYSMNEEFGDSERLRQSRFEVLQELPLDVYQCKLREARQQVASATHWLMELTMMFPTSKPTPAAKG